MSEENKRSAFAQAKCFPENIVKRTCKELGITQKELAERIGVHENTVSLWARGAIEMPEWSYKMMELLIIEKKYNTIKHFFLDNLQQK
jgi:transcriptional regulator with XRE-family HTH domain